MAGRAQRRRVEEGTVPFEEPMADLEAESGKIEHQGLLRFRRRGQILLLVLRTLPLS